MTGSEESRGNAKEEALARAAGLVFLCSGNMVRSAFADLYAKHLGCPLPVLSAATTYRNDSLFPETARALAAQGISRSAIRAFRPTHMDDLLPELRADHAILGMRWHHLEALERWPAHHANGFLLDATEIADPVLEGADFDATFARVARCVERLVQDLKDGRP